MINKTYILTLSLILLAGNLFAQPNSSSVFEDVTDTPVNGGLAAMLAVGIGYGIKKLYNKSK